MVWKIGAVLLVVGSIVGAVVRLRQGEYIYLTASLVGISIAVWLWNKGNRPASRTDRDPAPE